MQCPLFCVWVGFLIVFRSQLTSFFSWNEQQTGRPDLSKIALAGGLRECSGRYATFGHSVTPEPPEIALAGCENAGGKYATFGPFCNS